MIPSILDSVKKSLNVDPSETAFDQDILMHINSVFGTLSQLGVGPEDGFSVDDNAAVWTDFLGNGKAYNEVKSYIVLRVRLMFDPPTMSFLVTSIQEQIKELEWRLNITRETALWPVQSPTTEIDGGSV